MGLRRWNPIRDMLAMQSAMDRMFEDSRRGFNEGTAMPLDIDEDAKGYEIRSALPGVDPASIQVRLHDGVLTITAEVRRKEAMRDAGANREAGAAEGASASEATGAGYDATSETNTGQTPKRRTLMQENYYGKYTRSIRLPETVDDENVTAEYENGVLTLTLPKVAKAQPKQIEVQVRK